ADAKTKVYGDSDPSLTYTVSPSLLSGDALTGSLSRATGENVGTYAISSSLANSNYAISFTSDDLTISQKAITIIADAKTKVYGDSDPSLTYTVSPSLLSGDALTGSLSRATGENVGTYAISSSLANSNYAISFTTDDLTISQKAITIVADAKTKVYGDSDPSLTYTVSPSLLSGDALTGSLSRATGENVGTYAISSSLANSNYAISFTTDDLTITKANQNITFDPITHDDEDSFELTATSTSGLTITYSSSDTSIATINGNMITVIGTGNVTITASQPGNNNYNAATDVSQILNITTLSISDFSFTSSNVLLYPNPSKNNIKIRLGIEKANINIYDMSGKLVKTHKDYISDNNIDISDLPIGVFILRINNNKKMITKRLTKTE
ncbi:MBG domain-containing protein, partial [Polaribacter sp. OB-PA-B3]